jgi:hypothetical protein
MKRKYFFVVVTVLLLALTSFSLSPPSPVMADQLVQVSGIAYFAEEGQCNDPQGANDDFALYVTGDLRGCLYTFIETSTCSPSGTYVETGHEIFVGEGPDGSGTFTTHYRFEAKYHDCATLQGEIIGRCQHPIVSGSGTGAFSGVKGQLNFRDDVELVQFPYTGHLK